MTKKECYEKVGSDYDGVLKRLGSEALVKRFAVKFLNDPSFQELTDGLAAQDGEKAFRAAHTLKGLCLNLGFTELYKVRFRSFIVTLFAMHRNHVSHVFAPYFLGFL